MAEKEDRYFLKNVCISIDDKKIKDSTGEITVFVNKKQDLKIGISNSEVRMAKNVEIGFIFSSDFIIEKISYYSIYTDETKQIVRYTTRFLQGHTHSNMGHLIITPIKVGDYKITTFIKAENIESIYRDVNLRVTERPVTEIVKEILEKQQR